MRSARNGAHIGAPGLPKPAFAVKKAVQPWAKGLIVTRQPALRPCITIHTMTLRVAQPVDGAIGYDFVVTFKAGVHLRSDDNVASCQQESNPQIGVPAAPVKYRKVPSCTGFAFLNPG